MSPKNKISLNSEKVRYTLRFATIKDLDQIYQIELKSFKDPYPLGLLHNFILDRNSITLIIELDRKIVGYTFGLIHSGEIGHIISVAVSPEYRNRGLGSILIENLISALKKEGLSKIELEVRISNKIAQELYKKFDFVFKEIKRYYYSDGEDAYFMVCNIRK